MTVDKYLRLKQVCEITALSRATIYNMEKAGDFPAKTALGARAVAWRESEVAAWMEKRRTAVKSGHEAKPGRPPVRKADLSTKTCESAAELDSKNTSQTAEKCDTAPKQVSDFSDWPDEVDMLPLPKPDLRPTQPSKRLKARKENLVMVKRRGKTIDLLANFKTPGIGKSKSGK